MTPCLLFLGSMDTILPQIAKSLKTNCPHCGQSIQLNNPKSVAAVVLKCPQCQKEIPISFVHPTDEPSEEKTVLSSKVYKEFTGHLLCEGKSYFLSYGEHIVGRKSSMPIGIPLETNDPYMSRQHAYIKVTRLLDGRVITTLRPALNKNKILINGLSLEGDDEVTLLDNTEIMMGKTIVIFRNK